MKAELHGLKGWIAVSDPILLRALGENALKEADFEILGFMEHHFSPEGYTCIWLLGESHFAIHSYPEHQKSYLELTSCVLEKRTGFLNALERSCPIVSPVLDVVS